MSINDFEQRTLDTFQEGPSSISYGLIYGELKIYMFF